ncbi:hypothetical protein F4802DRAFT_242027 [Xylaria palmicola]|nr:hypothetical protein F4802DRAFT_242027 [Xylaria palmicola]
MDLERGSTLPSITNEWAWIIWSWQTVVDIGSRLCATLKGSRLNANLDSTKPDEQIEDFPQGYPRYSALIASDEAFYICRGFSYLRSRILLLKQDRLVVLEKRLREIDDAETVPLFLGASREDTNTQRRQVLDEIDVALSEYYRFMERASRALSLRRPPRRNVSSLTNWLNGTAALARDETAYLINTNDLVSLSSSGDGLVTSMEALAEDGLIRFHKGFRSLSGNRRSRDSHVYLYSGALVRRLSHVAISTLVALLLIAPIIVCSAVQSIPLRLALILIATMMLLMTMATISYRGTAELFIAGATYCAVLVVFISGNSSSSP